MSQDLPPARGSVNIYPFPKPNLEDLLQEQQTTKAAVRFILFTVMLDILALGIVIPVLPALVSEMVGGDTALTAKIFGTFVTTWAVIHFFASPIIGALSDRFGRRPVILLSNIGLAIDYLIMALAPNLPWLFFGRVLSGATSASITTAYAYIADVTPAKDRAAKFGFIGAAFGIGFVFGPAIGGLAGSVSSRLPFYIAAALSFINTCYGFFVLPESLPKEKRSAFSFKKANPIGSIGLLKTSNVLLLLAIVEFLNFLAHESLPTTFVIYTTHRYQWSERTVGLVFAFVGVLTGLVQGGTIAKVVKKIGETNTIYLGLVMGIIGFFIYAYAQTTTMFFVGLLVAAAWGLTGPTLQGVMSHLVSEQDQGKLQGAIGSIRSIASLIGPTAFSLPFSYAIAQQSEGLPIGIAFYLASASLLLSLLLCLWIFRKKNA